MLDKVGAIDVRADDPVIADAPETAGMSRLLRHSSLYLFANIAGKLIGFLLIPFYARYLSTDEYGVLNLLELATTIVALSFGLQTTGQSMTRIYHDQTTEAGQAATVSTALLGTIALAALVALPAALAAGPIGVAVGLPGQGPLLRLAFAAMFFSSIAEIVLVYERMRQRARFYLTYSMATLVATLLFNVVLIGVVHLGVWGFVASKLLVTGTSSLYLLARTLRAVGVGWSTPIARALVRFAGPLILSGVCYFAIHFSDRLFLARVSRAEVGVYSLVYTFAFMLSALVGDSFSKSWNVSLYGLASGAGWQARFVQVGRWLVFVLGAGSIGIALFGRDILTVMVPASYLPPLLMLPLLVFGYFLREVGDFFNSMLLIGIGSGLVGRIAIGGAVLNLGLNAVLIPAYGIWGAAWATFVTWAVYCVTCWTFAWRVHRVAMKPWPLLFVLGLSVLCLWVRFMAPTLVQAAGPVARLACDTACFGLFAAASIAFYLRAPERQEAYVLVRRFAGLAVRRSVSALS